MIPSFFAYGFTLGYLTSLTSNEGKTASERRRGAFVHVNSRAGFFNMRRGLPMESVVKVVVWGSERPEEFLGFFC